MRFGRVVEVSAAVAATRSRLAKTDEIRSLLVDSGTDEMPVVVAWLSGVVPQGRIGIGYRLLARLDVAASTDTDTPLTVADVDAAIGEIATTSGVGSTTRRTETLTELFGRAGVAEQDFLRRLLTGELRQGAQAGVMTEAIAAASGQPAAAVRRAHMLTGSLTETAGLAARGAAALDAVRLQVGRPVSPMLATPADSVATALAELGGDESGGDRSGGVIVDHKLDGARIQVHRDGDDIRVFTRTLRDVTAQVPDLVSVIAGLPCRTVILDGETLTLRDDGRPRPFQETMSRFGSRSDDADAPRVLQPYFFDCLHLDGTDLIDRPLTERLDALDAVAAQLRIPSARVTTAVDAQARFDAAITGGHEGVVMKSPSGLYAAGRRGRAWQKVKPVHTLDLVVLGAEWGSGRRRGLLSNLHLGARDPDGGPPVMVGKTFKGLTDELLAWQTDEFPRHERLRTAHTVYLHPELVVEIAVDGVQQSTRYPGGVALRFARVVRYRPDKTADLADTIDAVRALRG